MNPATLQISAYVSFAMTEEVRARLIYSGTLLAVVCGCALIAWVMAKRKRKRKTKLQHRWEEKPAPNESRHAHRYHRKVRTERPQNPTLAETGGLPPRKPRASSTSDPDTLPPNPPDHSA